MDKAESTKGIQSPGPRSDPSIRLECLKLAKSILSNAGQKTTGTAVVAEAEILSRWIESE